MAFIEKYNSDILQIDNGIIAHGVNCQGKMGKGLAALIKNKWPIVYQEYIKLYNTRKNLLGTVQFIQVGQNPPLVIANAFTQQYYGNDKKTYADINAIRQCLFSLAKYANENYLDLHIPEIGCGLGGLSWNDVRFIAVNVQRLYGIDLYVHKL